MKKARFRGLFDCRKLFCVFACSKFPDNVYLYLSGIFKLFFNLLCNILCKEKRLRIVNLLGFYYYTYLSSRLNSIALINTAEATGNLFKLFKTLNIVRARLSSCSGSGASYCICCGNEDRFNCLRLTITVMRSYSVYNFIAFTIFLSKVCTKLNVSSFLFVIYRLAYIV